MIKPVRLTSLNRQLFTFLFGAFTSLQAHSNVITEDFSTTTNKDSSTAVWNTELGVIHPTMKVDYTVNSGDATATAAVDVSDGIDGAFELATYNNFGTVLGNVITIDASLRPILKVTRFTLDSGYTLTSVNGPLVIHSLSTVNINGTIQCSGYNGSSTASGNTIGAAGGDGRCGGYPGGFGGNANQVGNAGFSPLALPGGAGSGGGINSGGGGAGAYSSSPAFAGTGAAGGSPGASLPDHTFTNISGSPGGGGGGGGIDGGGGGGGGGGAVVIHAVGDVNISSTGAILAKGGSGGTSVNGGGGGGGGGGSIKIFTPGIIRLDGTLQPCADADLGAGMPGGGGNGGNASYGRTWLASWSNIPALNSWEYPGSLLFDPGTINYLTTAQVVISKSIDTGNSSPTFNSLTPSPVSADVVYEVAGSNDNFVADDTGWLNVSLLTNLNTKQYIKFKMTLTNSNPTTPTQITSVSVDYTPYVAPVSPPAAPPSSPTTSTAFKEDFQFKSGCGMVAKNPPAGPNHLSIIVLLFSLPLLIALRLRLKTVRTQ